MIEVGDDEGNGDMSKGLFSLPFMRRAAERQKLAAEKDAKMLLAELDGYVNETEQPVSGRRNFGLEGGIQVEIPSPPSLSLRLRRRNVIKLANLNRISWTSQAFLWLDGHIIFFQIS